MACFSIEVMKRAKNERSLFFDRLTTDVFKHNKILGISKYKCVAVVGVDIMECFS